MRPIGDPAHPAMLDRIPVDVIRVAIKIFLVTNHVLPETALPYSPFAAICPALGNTLTFFNRAGKLPLIKFHRVEKSASPSGNVMMQCRCSGKTTAASKRNRCRLRTDPNAERNTSIWSTSKLFPLRWARFTVKNQLAPGTWARRYSVMMYLLCHIVTRAMRFVPHRILPCWRGFQCSRRVELSDSARGSADVPVGKCRFKPTGTSALPFFGLGLSGSG